MATAGECGAAMLEAWTAGNCCSAATLYRSIRMDV
jgi:hypothetical protein